MSRQTTQSLALLLAFLMAATGCVPTQPLYLREDGDLSHYLDQAVQLETPDVNHTPLAEVTMADAPHTISNPEFREIWDLSLEECVAIALNNMKVIRGANAPGMQTTAQAVQILAGADSVGPTQFAGFDANSNTPSIFTIGIVESRTGGVDGIDQNEFLNSNIGGVPSAGAAANQGTEAALSEFDAYFGADFGFQRQDRPTNVLPTFGGFPNTNNSFATISQQPGGVNGFRLSKKTRSGAHFILSNDISYDRGNAFGNLRALPSDWTAELEMEARFPILRGAGAQVNGAPIIISRIQTDKNLASLYTNLQNAVCNIEIRYWDLYDAYRKLESAKVGRDSALRTWKLVKARLDGGEADTQQEAQARGQYFSFRAVVEAALNNVYSAETNLRWLMGLAATDHRLIRPKDEPTLANVEFDGRAVIDEATTRRPSVTQLKWEIKERETEMILARNKLLPRLNASGGYRFVGRGDQLIGANRNGINYPGVGSRAYENLTDGDFQEFFFLLDLDMPIGFREQLSYLRNVQLRLARDRAVLEDHQLDVTREVSETLRAINANYHLAQSHFNRWVAATKEEEVLELRTEEGVERLDLLLEAQTRRVQTQDAYYTAITQYNKAIALLHCRKGSILEYNGIQFSEGAWPEKAYFDALGHARRRDAGTYLNYGWTRPRVISRGPIEQYGGTYFESEQSLDLGEQVPTPAPTNSVPGGNMKPMNDGDLPSPDMPPNLDMNQNKSASADPVTVPNSRVVQAGGEVPTESRGVPAEFNWREMGLEIPRR